MHKFWRAKDGVYGTRRYAFSAANAFGFANYGNFSYFFDAISSIQWYGGNIKQVCHILYGGFTAWCAFVDCITLGYGLCIGLAAWIPALTALGLRQ
jgi:type IV secretory pathway VirB2 component (pilin)